MSTIYKEQSTYCPMISESREFDGFSGVTELWNRRGLHCHDFFEFYIFFSGMPYFCIDDQVIPLHTCTLVIIPPFYLHGLMTDQPVTSYDRSWLCLTGSMLQSLGMGIQDFSEMFKKFVREGRAHFYIDYDRGVKLRTMIESILASADTGNKLDQWKNLVTMAGFISEIYDIASKSEANSSPIVINSTIQAMLNYISNHFTEDISVSDIAREFNLSSSYISRTFSSYTGRSIYEYILYRRITLAKQMICAGKNFTEVAFECGFNDYSGFLRAFTKVTGQSPREYRKYINLL